MEFGPALESKLVEEKKVSPSTAATYLKTLTILNDKKPLKNLNFLKKTEEILPRIAEYAESSQRAILATIVSVLSLFPKMKKTYEVYRAAMMTRVEEGKKVAEETKGTKSKKQEENWMTWDEVNAVKDKLAAEVAEDVKNKTLNVGEFEKVLHHLVLSLYTDIQPRRNADYTEMRVVKSWKEDAPKEHNYYDIKGKRFIFNKFKTAKTYGQQIVELPQSLVDTLTYYIKRHPLAKERKTDYPLLVEASGEPLVAVNAITRILNKIFGKKVGSSMLRHIFVTDKYGGVKKEQIKDALAMGHSVAEQQNVYNVPQSITIPTLEG
jgi:integrase